ncbi:MAG TPA: hypothetical protein PKI03_25180 [Pseudomonadota bacterium]|nr:hypothetical protein [Pseudomonadota bacterium]
MSLLPLALVALLGPPPPAVAQPAPTPAAQPAATAKPGPTAQPAAAAQPAPAAQQPAPATRPAPAAQPAATAQPAPTAQPAAASPRRYSYELSANPGAGRAAAWTKVTWVETGRRTVGGLTALDFSLFQGDKPMSEADLEALGIHDTPVSSFATQWTLLFGRGFTQFIEGGLPSEPEEQARALASATTFRSRDQGKPRKVLPDEAFYYGKRIGKWSCICRGYMHPSPDTGDFFESETCFAPNVGITLRSFSSVWGDFTLRLLAPPPSPSFP